MMNTVRAIKWGWLAAAAAWMSVSVSGCVTTEVKPPSATSKTYYRQISEEPVNPELDVPTVKDFLSACDLMARDLVMSAAVQTAERPMIVEIKPIENKTGQDLDLTIYPQTIRGYINKQGVRKVAFRDETARAQIVPERIEQSGSSTIVQDHTEITQTRNVAGNKYSLGMPPDNVQESSQRTMNRTAEVTTRVADVDYFLNGLIYAASEPSGHTRNEGYRYFQFQFRLTNARTGIVEWENMYQIKLEGDITGTRHREHNDNY